MALMTKAEYKECNFLGLYSYSCFETEACEMAYDETVTTRYLIDNRDDDKVCLDALCMRMEEYESQNNIRVVN